MHPARTRGSFTSSNLCLRRKSCLGKLDVVGEVSTYLIDLIGYRLKIGWPKNWHREFKKILTSVVPWPMLIREIKKCTSTIVSIPSCVWYLKPIWKKASMGIVIPDGTKMFEANKSSDALNLLLPQLQVTLLVLCSWHRNAAQRPKNGMGWYCDKPNQPIPCFAMVYNWQHHPNGETMLVNCGWFIARFTALPPYNIYIYVYIYIYCIVLYYIYICPGHMSILAYQTHVKYFFFKSRTVLNPSNWRRLVKSPSGICGTSRRPSSIGMASESILEELDQQTEDILYWDIMG